MRLSDGDLLIGHPAFTLRATGAGHPLVAALGEQSALPEKTVVGIRPEDIQVFAAIPGSDALPAEVSVIEPLGGETIVDLLVGPDIIKAIVPPAQQLSEGQAGRSGSTRTGSICLTPPQGCVATRRGRRPGLSVLAAFHYSVMKILNA